MTSSTPVNASVEPSGLNLGVLTISKAPRFVLSPLRSKVRISGVVRSSARGDLLATTTKPLLSGDQL